MPPGFLPTQTTTDWLPVPLRTHHQLRPLTPAGVELYISGWSVSFSGPAPVCITPPVTPLLSVNGLLCLSSLNNSFVVHKCLCVPNLTVWQGNDISNMGIQPLRWQHMPRVVPPVLWLQKSMIIAQWGTITFPVVAIFLDLGRAASTCRAAWVTFPLSSSLLPLS